MEMHGFKLAGEAQLEELDSLARLWVHSKSGAQVLSLSNKDENKVFGVSFRTPPHDSTGLPHILEHSVLCGSDKYPVKEPFVELLKGSLQTFLNAFTYPDKTCYPVASANLQDFYNLIDVYLDAAFHPRISEEIFQQEGWHLDAVQEEGQNEPKISFKGVVYNEMKGVFSSPEAVLERESLHHLFPDTPYGLESGGDPAVIPSLTFEDFVSFHRRYYHPTNARFYFWGDDPEEKRLEILGAELANYEAIAVENSRVPLQKPFNQPQNLRLPFAAGDDDKAMFTLNWVLPPVGASQLEAERTLAFAMLEHILLGMPASPLRRALMESGLGEDLAGSGMQDELKQIMFSIGLKGIAEADAPKVEELILSTLTTLVDEGIPKASIEAAINSIEFELRENNTGRFPVGLAVMLRSLTTWLHADEPSLEAVLAPLRHNAPLAAIKEKAAMPLATPEQGYFEGLIRDHLLRNTHRASLLLYPDTTLGAVQEQEEEKRLNALTSSMSAEQKAELVKLTEKLQKLQETPDSPEALATIPRLRVEDMPTENKEITQQDIPGLGVPFWFHPQATHGICYLSAHFDISAVPDRLLPVLPLLGRAMQEMGNADKDYVALNMEIASKTGGIDADLTLLTRLAGGMPLGALSVSGKAAPDKIPSLVSLMQEVLGKTDLNNQEHFTRILLEEKARLEHGLIPSGHAAVAGRLKSSLSPTGWLREKTSGISYLEEVRAMAAEAVSNWPQLLKNLEETRKILLSRSGMLLSATAEPAQLGEIIEQLGSFVQSVPSGGPSPVARSLEELPEFEALITPAQVNFVGRGVNLFEHGYEFHGSALVILKYLRTGYLWEKIRVQGGAYGAICSLDRGSGDFILASYRDPNIESTLKAYDNCAAFLIDHRPSQAELDAAIVGAIGDIDSYMLPEAKGNAALTRKLCGDNAELRAQLRAEVLGTSVEDIRRFGEILESAMLNTRSAALGGTALEELAKREDWDIKKIL